MCTLVSSFVHVSLLRCFSFCFFVLCWGGMRMNDQTTAQEAYMTKKDKAKAHNNKSRKRMKTTCVCVLRKRSTMHGILQLYCMFSILRCTPKTHCPRSASQTRCSRSPTKSLWRVVHSASNLSRTTSEQGHGDGLRCCNSINFELDPESSENS